jgi:hypothetical protein
MCNADGRQDGAEKADRHDKLCRTFLAYHHKCNPDLSRRKHNDDWWKVHNKTQELTSFMDEKIGFPLKGRPDYDKLAPLFFDMFIELATAAITKIEGD